MTLTTYLEWAIRKLKMNLQYLSWRTTAYTNVQALVSTEIYISSRSSSGQSCNLLKARGKRFWWKTFACASLQRGIGYRHAWFKRRQSRARYTPLQHRVGSCLSKSWFCIYCILLPYGHTILKNDIAKLKYDFLLDCIVNVDYYIACYFERNVGMKFKLLHGFGLTSIGCLTIIICTK